MGRQVPHFSPWLLMQRFRRLGDAPSDVDDDDEPKDRDYAQVCVRYTQNYFEIESHELFSAKQAVITDLFMDLAPGL